MTDGVLKKYLGEPGGHLLLSPDLTVLDMGPQFARMTFLDPQAAIGKKLAELFPIDEKNNLSPEIVSSIGRAKSTLDPDKSAVFRYDLDRPTLASRDRERWWAVTHIPIVEDGQLRYLVQRLEDHTSEARMRSALDAQRRSNYILYVLVLIFVGVAVWKFTGIGNTLSRQASQTGVIATQASAAAYEAAVAARDSQQTVAQYRIIRQSELKDICSTTDQLVSKIQQLIIVSTQETKPFEKSLRSLGLPPYRTRLQRAREQAKSLNLVNCQSIK